MTEEARNRWSEIHKRKTNGSSAKGARRLAGAPGFPLYTSITGNPLVADHDLSSDMICVCMIVEGIDLARLDLAVQRTLADSHQNVQLVLVAGKPGALLESFADAAWAKDPRVHLIASVGEVAGVGQDEGDAACLWPSQNALRADVLRYTCAPYIAFLGEEDLPHVERLAQQLRAILETGADACFSAAQEASTVRVVPAGTEPTEHLGELAPPVGLFRTESLLAVGGIHPERGGLRLATTAMALLGRVVVNRVVLYTRAGDSLVDEPGPEVEEIYGTVYQARSVSVGTAVQKMRGAILRACHANASKGSPATHARITGAALRTEPPAPSAAQIDAILRLVPPEFAGAGDWQARARCLADRLATAKPIHTLITGSCPEVLIAAAQACRHPQERRFVTVLESDMERASALRGLLASLGLSSVVTVRTSPLREFPDVERGYVWYELSTAALSDRVPPSFLYLDGPPRVSRHGALVRLQPVLRASTEIWLTPGTGQSQDAEVAFWKARVPLEDLSHVNGVRRLRATYDPDAAAEIAVTVLTGARPMLLRRTLSTLAAKDAGLVAQAKVVVLVNGGDEESLKIAKSFAFVDEVLTTPELLPVAEAMNVLMDIDFGAARFVLHLEDDFECRASGWRGTAVRLLDECETIGQVLLHGTEPSHVALNQVSGRRVSWEQKHSNWGFTYRAARDSFSTGPSLIRRVLVDELWPAKTTTQVLERFHALELDCAVVRGGFVHVGDGHSLKKKMGREE